MPLIGGEDLPQHDRHRPAVDDDVVVGQHEPVPVLAGADQRRPEGRRSGQVAHRDPFGGTYLLDLLLGVELQVLPWQRGISRDELHRLVVAEPGRQIRVAGENGLHGGMQPLRVENTGDREIQLHRVYVASGGGGVKEQTLLNGCQRQHIGDVVPRLQFVDLLLRQPGRHDVRRRQPTSAAAHLGTDAGQCLKPQPAQPVYLSPVEDRRRPRPVRMQLWAGLGLDGDGVDFDGVHQRHRQPRVTVGNPGADGPGLAARLNGCTQAAEVVETDDRLGAGQLDITVEVTQQPVGQWMWHAAQLFFEVLDRRTERRVTRHHLRPVRSPDAHGDRVSGGEPAHRVGQVHPGRNVVVSPVPLDVDQNRRTAGAEELGPREGESDQQNVLHPSVKRGGHCPEQHSGGVGVQSYREPPGGTQRVRLGSHRRQRVGRGQHLPPCGGRVDHRPSMGVLVQQRRPPLKRGARRRQRHLSAIAQLAPSGVDVVEQNPPRHPIDGQVVNDQGQLTGWRAPLRAQHPAGHWIQSGSSLRQRLWRQFGHLLQAAGGIGTRFWHPPALTVAPQAQRRVPVDQGLQDHPDVGFGGSGRRLQHHRLVELLHRAGVTLPPAHDRGGHQLSGAFVD